MFDMLGQLRIQFLSYLDPFLVNLGELSIHHCLHIKVICNFTRDSKQSLSVIFYRLVKKDNAESHQVYMNSMG